MTVTLRPMNLGEILDRTFHIYRSRFSTFVTLAFLPSIAMLALEAANRFSWKLLPNAYGPRVFLWYTPQNLLYMLVLGHAEIFLNFIFWPAVSLLVSKDLWGEKLSASAAIVEARPRWRSGVGLILANWTLVLIVPDLLLFGLLAGTAYLLFEIMKLDADDPRKLGLKMLLAALIAGWAAFQWLSAGLSFSFPVWAIERSNIRTALRRSRKLSCGSRIRVVFARIVPVVIGAILGLGFGSLVLYIIYLSLRHTHSWRSSYLSISTSVSLLVEFVVASFLGPIFPIALTLIYYDQRIRLEGYDIETMMASAGMNAPADPAAQEVVEKIALIEEPQG